MGSLGICAVLEKRLAGMFRQWQMMVLAGLKWPVCSSPPSGAAKASPLPRPILGQLPQPPACRSAPLREHWPLRRELSPTAQAVSEPFLPPPGEAMCPVWTGAIDPFSSACFRDLTLPVFLAFSSFLSFSLQLFFFLLALCHCLIKSGPWCGCPLWTTRSSFCHIWVSNLIDEQMIYFEKENTKLFG